MRLRSFLLAALLAVQPAVASTFTALAAFPGGGDGLLPFGGLVSLKGKFYSTTEYGGANGRGAVFSIDPASGAETLIYSFKCCSDPTILQTGLTRGGSLLYGIGSYGGANDFGAVFSVDPTTGSEKVLYSLTAATGGGSNTPLLYANGYLYGMTFAGNPTNCGVVFKVNVATGAGTTLHSFVGGSSDGCNGAYGGFVQVGSLLYGVTLRGGVANGGTIFSIDPTTGAETVVYNVGTGPEGLTSTALAAAGTTLFMTTSGGGANGSGTLSAFDTATNTLSVLHAFGASDDGTSPFAAPTVNGGMLYGTTYGGGANNTGIVYATAIATGATTTLASFGVTTGHPQAPLTLSGKTLYGTSTGPATVGGNAGTVFALKPGAAATKTLHTFDGPHPYFQRRARLVTAGALLYGTTENGGAAYAGTVYAFDPATNAQTTVYQFAGGADGVAPVGRLLASGATLYGATLAGGAANAGSIFAFDTKTKAKTTLYSFTGGADGQSPNGDLVLHKGLLYGTTQTSASATGTIFALDPAKGTLTTVYRFGGGTDGISPAAGLIEKNGVLYGTTDAGGSGFGGTVFSFDIASASLTVLHSFGGTDGDYPAAPLLAVGSTLYGTTYVGGSSSCFCGTVFGYDTKTATFTSLYQFTGGSDGNYPLDEALASLGGLLYGATAGNAGTIFSVAPGSGRLTTLYTFTGGSDGFGPSGGLLEQGGALFGVSSFGGAPGAGTIFSLKP